MRFSCIKSVLVIVLFGILLAGVLYFYSPEYQQANFALYGNAEKGWIFITPKVAYYSMWLGNELGTIGEDGFCVMIKRGNPYDCAAEDFSILLYNYPTEGIEKLR